MKKDRFSLLGQVTIFVELSGMGRVIYAFRLVLQIGSSTTKNGKLIAMLFVANKIVLSALSYDESSSFP